MQYERVTSLEGDKVEELRRLDSFLGLEPTAELEPHNVRKHHINSGGWALTRDQYQALIEIVRPDVEG